MKKAIIVIIILIVAFLIWKYSAKKPVPETPVEALDKSTQMDTTSSIEANLNSIDVDTKADGDLNAIDQDLKAL